MAEAYPSNISDTESKGKSPIALPIEASCVKGYNYLKGEILFADTCSDATLKRSPSGAIILVQKKADMQEDTITLRDIPLKEAVKEIADLFKRKKRLFYSDIVEELQLDFGTVIKACRKLEKEGKIEGINRGQKRAKKSSK